MFEKIPDADKHFAFAYDPDKMIIEHRETRNQQVYVTDLQIKPDGSYTISTSKSPVSKPTQHN